MRKLFLALTLVSGLAIANPFNGHWATSPIACKANTEQLNGGQFNVTITPRSVILLGWNFFRLERVEEVWESNNHNFFYSGEYMERWDTDESDGVVDTNWTLNNGVLKSANSHIKFRKCK